MKNIAFFASRKHHAEKLSPIYFHMKERHNAFWLTCNNSINIDSPLEFLSNGNEPFVHVYDRPLSSSELKRIDRTEADILRSLLSQNSNVAPFWLSHTAREYAELNVLFNNFLSTEKIDAVIVLHNANFFSRILSSIAIKKGIPVFSFQEGALRERDQVTFDKQRLATDYTTKTFCWSRDDLQRYQKANPSSSLMVGGLYHLDGVQRNSNGQTVAFAPTISSEYKGSILDDAMWIKSYCDRYGYTFAFKPHPFEHDKYQSNIPAFRGSALELLSVSDYIISQHSTIMIEAATLGLNVAEVNRSPHPTTESLAGKAYFLIEEEKDLHTFITEGFSSKKWAKSQGYKIGSRTDVIVKEIEKWL